MGLALVALLATGCNTPVQRRDWSATHLEWLTEALGPEHVKFFPTGGHLGGLFKPEVQEAVMESVIDLVESEGPEIPRRAEGL